MLHPQDACITTVRYDKIRYDTIEEFKVDSKIECDQLNLAQLAKNKT